MSTVRQVKSEELALTIEYDREDDGRWIAEIGSIPGVCGVLEYGDTKLDAENNVKHLALEIIEDRVTRGEMVRPTDVKFL